MGACALMARSSATRRGNGAGWGGPKKGEGHTFTPGDPEAQRTGADNSNNSRKVTVADLMAGMDARKIAAEAWMAILADTSHPKHAEMVAKAAERMDGAPVQPVMAEGPGLVINVVKRFDE